MKIFTTVKRKLKRAAAAGLVGAVLVTSLAACGKKKEEKTADGQTVTTINVGVITAGDKTSFVDDKGKLTGYEIELMRKIDEELPQYKFNFVQLEGPTLFSSLDAKKVDFISGNFRRSDAREEGILETLIGLVKKDLLTVTQAAEEAHMTVPEFEEKTGLKA